MFLLKRNLLILGEVFRVDFGHVPDVADLGAGTTGGHGPDL